MRKKPIGAIVATTGILAALAVGCIYAASETSERQGATGAGSATVAEAVTASPSPSIPTVVAPNGSPTPNLGPGSSPPAAPDAELQLVVDRSEQMFGADVASAAGQARASAIQSLFVGKQGKETAGAHLTQVECRSKVCRITIGYESLGREVAVSNQLLDARGITSQIGPVSAQFYVRAAPTTKDEAGPREGGRAYVFLDGNPFGPPAEHPGSLLGP